MVRLNVQTADIQKLINERRCIVSVNTDPSLSDGEHVVLDDGTDWLYISQVFTVSRDGVHLRGIVAILRRAVKSEK